MFDPSQADWHKKTLMDLHNTGLGRRTVVKSMQIKCVCQGTSGSCTTKICHRKVASIEEIGKSLMEKFSNPVKVTRDKSYYMLLDTSSTGTRANKNLQYRKGLVLSSPNTYPAYYQQPKAHPHATDLVYLEDVDRDYFCDRKPEWHIAGTKDRLCSSTSNGTDSCQHLCCGRQFVAKTTDVTEKCHCKFIWCCRVECQQCQRSVTVETCL